MTAVLTEFLFGSPSHLYWSLFALLVLSLVGVVVTHLLPDYRRTIIAVAAAPVLIFAISFVPLFGAGAPPASDPADAVARMEDLLFDVLQAAPLMLAFAGLLYATVMFMDDREQVRKRRSVRPMLTGRGPTNPK
jgi:ABC-type multidrug transport system fused ATPase/permease subunit